MATYYVRMSQDESWNDYFSTLEQAQSYATLAANLVKDQAKIINDNGITVAEYEYSLKAEDAVDAA